MADLARQMFRDCTYDLKDITMCRDCYRYANERQEKYWFCKPCRPFHELVYAKQKGFPYWPAKVMRVLEEGQNYDVRYVNTKLPGVNIFHFRDVNTTEIIYNFIITLLGFLAATIKEHLLKSLTSVQFRSIFTRCRYEHYHR